MPDEVKQQVVGWTSSDTRSSGEGIVARQRIIDHCPGRLERRVDVCHRSRLTIVTAQSERDRSGARIVRLAMHQVTAACRAEVAEHARRRLECARRPAPRSPAEIFEGHLRLGSESSCMSAPADRTMTTHNDLWFSCEHEAALAAEARTGHLGHGQILIE